MTKILFVCHGNICRSPMAEFMMKDLVKKRGMERDFLIASSATSAEEIGNPVHPGTASRLAREGISTAGKYAVQLKRTDYDRYDYFLGMDQWNVRNMKRILGGDPENKVHLLLDFTGRPGEEIADPWYTGDFERTYAPQANHQTVHGGTDVLAERDGQILSESQKFVRVLPSEKIVEVKSTFFNQINYEENFMGSMFDGCVESRRMQRRRER